MYCKPYKGNYKCSSQFGPRDLNGDGIISQGIFEQHKGFDVAMPIGTPLYAIEDGVVVVAGILDYVNPQSPNKGVSVRSNADGNFTTYMHMNKVSVVVNQHVKRGDLVGYSGNTGASTGPHLHMELTSGTRPFQTAIDPAKAGITAKNNQIVTYSQNWHEPGDDSALQKELQNIRRVQNEPSIETVVTETDYGISYVLKRLGSVDYAQEWQWATVAQANGYSSWDWPVYNNYIRAGQTMRVPKRLLQQNPTLALSTEAAKIIHKYGNDIESLTLTKPEDIDIFQDVNTRRQEPSIIPVASEGGRKPLPIYQRSIYDSLRNGSYAIGAFVLANGGQEVINELLTGEINEESLLTAGLGLGIIFLGYVQEQMKQKRKELEK